MKYYKSWWNEDERDHGETKKVLFEYFLIRLKKKVLFCEFAISTKSIFSLNKIKIRISSLYYNFI